MKAIIFANGEIKDGEMVERVLAKSEDACIVAADGGAKIAFSLGFVPEVVIGDVDSISHRELEQLLSQNTKVVRYPAEKDETDLEIALKWVAGKGFNWIRMIGALGGRMDHMLANIHLLALPELVDCDVQLVSANESVRLLHPGNHTMQGTFGDTISLIPVGDVVTGISTHYLKYPLDDETLYLGPARGISNVMLADTATVAFREGVLLIVHTIDCV